jgi:putative lipoprotein
MSRIAGGGVSVFENCHRSDQKEIAMIVRRTLLAMLALSAVAACSAPRGDAVTGTVGYRERMVLPADSVVVVRLDDVTRGPTYPAAISEQRIVPTSNSPIRFAVPYSRTDINPNGTYVVNAWIEQGGRVLFRNANMHQVLTKSAPSHNIHVELEQVLATTPPMPGTSTTTVYPASGGTVIVQPGSTVVTPAATPAPVTTAPVTAAPPPGTVVIPAAR